MLIYSLTLYRISDQQFRTSVRVGRLIDVTMSDPNLSFQFKIDAIRARHDAPPQSFTNGSYKPPVESNHYEQSGTTEWRQWTINGVSPATAAPSPITQAYSTSIFYDAITKRFLFHPADCRTINISTIENEHGDKWGWQQLCFTEFNSSHSLLDHDGEYSSLCGWAGTYTPHFLPPCYQSPENSTPCGLSGKMSLLLALTAFSCAPDRMIDAISHRLNFRERRWDNALDQNWGSGRKMHSCTIHFRTDC